MGPSSVLAPFPRVLPPDWALGSACGARRTPSRRCFVRFGRGPSVRCGQSAPEGARGLAIGEDLDDSLRYREALHLLLPLRLGLLDGREEFLQDADGPLEANVIGTDGVDLVGRPISVVVNFNEKV